MRCAFQMGCIRILGLSLLLIAMGGADVARAAGIPNPEKTCISAGASGGLVVMVNCGDPAAAGELARTGRYLVHVLETDAAKVEAAVAALHSEKVYGLAWAERLGGLKGGGSARLPYTENLVNVVFLGAQAAPGGVGLGEVARVLRPGGVVFCDAKTVSGADLSAAGLKAIGADSGAWRRAEKPWPKEMDAWSHPRHSASGNAVSGDEATGLPKRVRWVAGPQQEISNFVTAGGRAFYAGTFARDAFNGLKLWEEKLNPSPARGGFNQTVGSAVQPIAMGDLLVCYTDKVVRALDSATGNKVRDYPDAGTPVELLVDGKAILSINKDALHVVDLETGKLRWKQAAEAIRAVCAGDGFVCYMQGDVKKPKTLALVCRELAGGKVRWQVKGPEWLAKVKRTTYHGGLLACEISTLNDDKAGNILQMVSAVDGKPMWSREFIPGAAHKKQARGLFNAGLVWVLEAKKLVGLDPRSGEVQRTLAAGNVHCFPPVATTRYMFGGEMDLTDFLTGKVAASQITKQACSRDAGVVPANGLIYTFPKHCICWPMLRDYAALAPERPGGAIDWDKVVFAPEAGPATAPEGIASTDAGAEWPVYRHDALRSGATPGGVPQNLQLAWTTDLGGRATEGAIAQDWEDNFYIKGPVGPPVVGGGMVHVTRPDAHQVVAMDVASGQVRWAFTANGRVDTAPTYYRGLVLFGCKSGYVYGLRAADGQVVWRLRAAPVDERIVAYGQVESPWPVPGSVLVIDGVAYFAAGRQPLADGGVFVFAVEPESGKVKWHKRLNEVPQKNFYGSSGLEFDNFDLLQREGKSVAMSRWVFEMESGKMECKAKSGFLEAVEAGADKAGGVMVPRGAWSYAPRNESEQWKERPYVRPLVVFRDNALFGCSQDRGTVYRRDFKLDQGEKFDANWFAGWATYKGAREGKGDLWQAQRLSRGAAWTATPLGLTGKKKPVAAMTLAGDTLLVIGVDGTFRAVNAADGQVTGELTVPAPTWDGMAVAGGRVFVATQEGKVVCLAGK